MPRTYSCAPSPVKNSSISTSANRIPKSGKGHRSSTRVSNLLAAVVVIGVVTAGFVVVSGRAEGAGWPASVRKVFGIKTASPQLTARGTHSTTPLAPLAPNAVLLSWNTNGNAGTETTELSTTNDSNLSTANLTLGSVTPAGNGNRFGGSFWFDVGDTNPTTLAESVTGNDYIQFVVTPNAGFSFTPTSLVFTWDRSGTGPSSVTLRSSADSFATDLGTVSGITAGAFASNTITISGLTDLTTATTFRLYGYGATGTGGTGGFDTNVAGDNVILNGSTAAVAVAETDVAVTGGNLVITDVNGGNTADTLTIFLSGTDLRITDPNNILTAGAGTTQVDPNTVDVPFASITGNIQIDTLDGNDSLNVDSSTGDVIPDGGLSYNGGDPSTGPGDTLILTCGTQGNVTYNYTNASDGNIVMSNYGTITYTGLEPIINDGVADNIIFNLPAGPNAATLEDDDTSGNGMSRLSGATFETTNFWNPTGSLTINRGHASDTLAISDLPDFSASLTAGTVAAPFASLDFGGALGLDPNQNLSGVATGTISLTGIGVISTSGTGTVSLITTGNIALASGSSIEVDDGNLTLEANQQLVPSAGDFNGVDIDGGTVQSNGTGNISIKGVGGSGDFIENAGVQLTNGALVETTGTGTIDVQGTGGHGVGSGTAGQGNLGVYVTLGSTIVSDSSDIAVTGIGGTTNDSNVLGVVLNELGTVQTNGAGTLTLNGTGGTVNGGGFTFVNSGGVFISAGDVNGDGGLVTSTGSGANAGAINITGIASNGGNGAAQGLRIDTPGTVNTVDGDITINGTSAACGNACLGASIRGVVIASGAGSINVTGTGGATTGVFPTHGVNVRSTGRLSTLTGSITVTGTGGNGIDNADFNLASSGTGMLDTSGGPITVNANTIRINPAGVQAIITAGSGDINLLPRTNGVAINLGSTVDSTASTLELSDAELDRITGVLKVGNSLSGAITVSAAITRTAATTMFLTSGANIDIAAGSLDSNAGDVSLVPTTNVFPSHTGVDVTTGAAQTLTLTSATDLKISIASTTVDTGYTQLNVAGLINLNGANLSFAGSTHTPVAGDTFMVVNNDAGEAITGTFNGLSEGATISGFLGSALDATISYVGGDGNDAVLTVQAAVCVPPAIVYVDDDWAAAVPGTDPDGGGPATNFGCDSFATIQGGVGGVTTGGSVIVFAGTYNGPQILINRSMTVTGAGAATTIIDGLAAAPPSAGLVHIQTPAGDTGNVSVTGFTITNPGLVGGLRYAMFVKPLDPATTVTISNNEILGVNAASPNFDLGIWIYRNLGAVVFDNNEITNNSGNGVLIEQPLNSTNVHSNTISGTTANTSYFNMTYGSENVTSLQRVAGNTINGPLATAINFNTAPTFLTNPADRFGKFTNVQITDNIISNLGVGRSAIALLNDTTDTTGALGAIENPVVTGNIITGTDAATSNGIRLRGLITSASIKCNDIREVARGFFGEVTNTHSATGTAMHVNNIVGNASGVTWNGPVSLNAENNWWGCNDGPGNPSCDSVTGIVDFDPWLVLGVSAAPNPISPGGTSTVTADMRRNSLGADTSGLGTVPLTTMDFSATQGTMLPTSGTITAGVASSIFTSNSSNSGTGCAEVDSQTICTPITVVGAVTVSLPHVTGPAGSNISVPITVGDLTGKAVRSFDFQITFDPTRVQPLAVPYDTAGTISSGMTVTYDISNPGHLIVSASQATDLTGSGTLIKVLFNIVGAPGQSTPTTFEDYTDPGTVFHPGFRFNAVAPVATTSNGSISVNGPTAADGTVSGRIVDGNGNPVEGAAIRLTGTQNRLTVTDREGNYAFDDVETNGFYSVTPSRVNFMFTPVQRSFSQLGLNTEAVFVAANTANGLNPLDTTVYFVRQQYLDFLGREPDEAGLNFWVNSINSCGSDTDCLAARRIDTSAAFFLSIEFEQTGFLVHRMYQAAYGDMPGAPVPLRRSEFNPDKLKIGEGVIVNQRGWEAKLEANTKAFAQEFVQRARFASSYPASLAPAAFVDQLFLNAGVAPAESERAAVVEEFGDANDTANSEARARALRRVAENVKLRQQEFGQAFVLMQYFGYLGRDPNSGPDADFSGYSFWLNKLESFNGDYRSAEMVKAFLVAGEYRGRFPK